KHVPASKVVEYRRSNEFDHSVGGAKNYSKPLKLSQEIKVSFGTIEPVTTPYQTIEPVATTTVSPLWSTTTEADDLNVVTKPDDQCKCVCKSNLKLETYDIGLEELKLKLLQAEILA